jgi:hypothetical protein
MIKKREEVGVRPGTFYRSLPFSKREPFEKHEWNGENPAQKL